ncbi:MAG: DUF2723 domain-containing protein [Candidatus Krumholzibacteriia bacterium]
MNIHAIRRPQVLLATAIFALAFGVYLATLAPTISFWDCGEFITCSHIVGIPHQPGTPLYVLVGRVFDVLFGDPQITEPAFRTAWALNMMSAFFSALAVMLVYLIVLDLARRADPDSGWMAHAGAVVGALFLTFSETFWNNAVEAEVYGLSAFVMALVTWLALRWYEWRERPPSDLLLILIVYLLGLGVGFHLGVLLIFGGIFVLVLIARRWRASPDFWLVSAGLLLFILSMGVQNDLLLVLLLVLYLSVALWRGFAHGRWFALIGSAVFMLGISVHIMMLIRAGASPEPAINQTDPDTFSVLLSVLRREQYPTLNLLPRQADLGWQFGYYYGFLVDQFTFLSNGQGALARVSTFIGPIFLALFGVFHGIRRARPVIWLILVNYVINSHGLTLLLNFTDHEVRERDYFYFAAFMFVAVLIGLGSAALLRFAAGPEGLSLARIESESGAGGQGARQSAPAVRAGVLPRVTAAALVVVAALPLLLSQGVPFLGVPPHTKWFEHDRSDNRVPYEYARNILAGLDENAIIFTNGDNDTFPIWYLQEVEHFRRDVTVVNLSLVNLPWYVEQLRRREPPLDLSRSEQEIAALRPRLIEDPQTGQRQLLYVRDYVVHDIVTTNARRADARPVFFAVTIPRDNMELYFPHLSMEGLAYRLTPSKGPGDLPTTDGERLLANFFGVYRFSSLLTGADEPRHRRFAEMAGLGSDVAPGALDLDRVPAVNYQALVPLLGELRDDVYLDQNTRFLLGNYPVALARAGYQLREDGYEALRKDPTDTLTYDDRIGGALAAFELAGRLRPESDLVADFYPLLLLEHRRDRDALAYLDEVGPKLAPETRARAVANTAMAMAQVGQSHLAVEWLEEKIAAQPQDRIYHESLFRVFHFLGRRNEAERVVARWERLSGERDAAMQEALDTLDAQPRQQEVAP